MDGSPVETALTGVVVNKRKLSKKLVRAPCPDTAVASSDIGGMNMSTVSSGVTCDFDAGLLRS